AVLAVAVHQSREDQGGGNAEYPAFGVVAGADFPEGQSEREAAEQTRNFGGPEGGAAHGLSLQTPL
ncbi:hypothetical protein RZS08_42235, partial [Arthrospira platensis SPKY1]|nr:hypothetical protein [Arthrospira platensis SPKY1]